MAILPPKALVLDYIHLFTYFSHPCRVSHIGSTTPYIIQDQTGFLALWRFIYK